MGSQVMEVTLPRCRVVAARDKTGVILPAAPSVGAKARQHHHNLRTHTVLIPKHHWAIALREPMFRE